MGLRMVKVRKVQQTRTGTFFVCLTRSWAEKHGLKKGTQVALDETIDGRLCIDARFDAEPVPKVAVLSPGPFLSREIVARYLQGFDVIRVEAKERFDLEVRNRVKRTISSLVGLEIVEETSSLIVLQCLLPSSILSVETLLLRNYSIVAGMIRDAVTSLFDGDVQLAKSVVARDDESDRQYFLLVRALCTVVQNLRLGEKLGLNTIDCLNCRLAASFVEGLGDASVQIANLTLELDGEKLSEDLKNLLMNLQTTCCDASDRALKAFVNKDMALAEEVKSMLTKIDNLSKEIGNTAKNYAFVWMPKFLMAASFLKRVYDISVDLADLVV